MMTARQEKDKQKFIQDKCQQILTQMLRDEDNKYCVDCDAKGPRWASWNLGIFLCIRCAGIHRNLGVHISKVKSVNLDSWTPEQVVSLQQMGNSRARAVYEANLPDSFRRPQTDSALESFIRAKYETKKYIAQEWVPPPLPKVNWDKEMNEEAEKLKNKKRQTKNTVPISVEKIGVVPQAIPKPNVSPKKQREGKTGRSRSGGSEATPDLLGLDTPTSDAVPSSGSDDFTRFLSAGDVPLPASSDTWTPSRSRSEEEESFFNQPVSSTVGKLTTDSILALYTKGPTLPPAYVQPGQVQQFPYITPQPSNPVPPVFPVVLPSVPLVSQQISNPFYNIQHQQGNIQHNQLVDISQQLNGLTFPPTVSSTPPIQNKPKSLWQ